MTKQEKKYIKETYNVNTLLSKGSTNTKTAKNSITTFIMYLAPANQNNKNINLCPHSSKGCVKACLWTAGRGKFSNVKNARTNKANFYVNDKKLFIKQLVFEIKKEILKASNNNTKIAFRLNGTSDVDFIYLMNKYENFDIELIDYSKVYFYDYTPNLLRAIRYKNHRNYTLTFSKKEDNDKEVGIAIKHGINIAAVFRDELPKKYLDTKVIDGDKSDLEMLYNNNVILGLKAKGDAKKDTTGFVI